MDPKSAIVLTCFVVAVLGAAQIRNAADRNDHTTAATTDVHPAFERCRDERIRALVQSAGQRITPPTTVDASHVTPSLPREDCGKAHQSEISIL